ncbi:hypothetical protein AAFF_G00322040 [Aldrovandia affinis]|uniref:Rhodanese domain-containing protein n=1 Tax=Aldrovandia affinis TaxID=143900 RepID=A0AAD7SN12_9TELE|nr:hypothetical protein AAFF_G00322040 [Aldrovandia affinis]
MTNAEKVISYNDLKALLEKSSSLLVIDVRSKEEVDKGHIPGSIHMPVDTVESDMALDPSAFQAKFGIQKPPGCPRTGLPLSDGPSWGNSHGEGMGPGIPEGT